MSNDTQLVFSDLAGQLTGNLSTGKSEGNRRHMKADVIIIRLAVNSSKR